MAFWERGETHTNPRMLLAHSYLVGTQDKSSHRPRRRPLSEINNTNHPQVHAWMSRPLTIMTFLHVFPPNVVMWRNIDVLTLSEDQTIFLPDSSNISLLDRLEDSLGMSICLRPSLMWSRRLLSNRPTLASSPLWLRASATKLAQPGLYTMI